MTPGFAVWLLPTSPVQYKASAKSESPEQPCRVSLNSGGGHLHQEPSQVLLLLGNQTSPQPCRKGPVGRKNNRLQQNRGNWRDRLLGE